MEYPVPNKNAYTNWETGEPKDLGGREKCIVLRWSGTWNDDVCYNKFAFICQNDHFRIATVLTTFAVFRQFLPIKLDNFLETSYLFFK